jgi:penicillin-binding protein 2
MARLMATLVNGGKLYKPHLLIDNDEEPEPESTVEVNPEHTEFIKRALLGVVYEGGGTGGLARSDIVSIGGKTGTAQVIGGAVKGKYLPEEYQDHAWFVAFAPQNNPEIAVSVFVEHGGHGGSVAAPIAKRVIETYLNPPKPESEIEKAERRSWRIQNPEDHEQQSGH